MVSCFCAQTFSSQMHPHRERPHKDCRPKAASTLQRLMKRKKEGVEEIKNRTLSTLYFLQYLQRSLLSEMSFPDLWRLIKQACVIWYCDNMSVRRCEEIQFTARSEVSLIHVSKNIQNNTIKQQMRNRQFNRSGCENSSYNVTNRLTV